MSVETALTSKAAPELIHTGGPLFVDMDGTLLAGDTLHEGLIELIKRAPLKLLLLPAWLMQGKAAFKRHIAQHTGLDPASLPYRPEVLDWRGR